MLLVICVFPWFYTHTIVDPLIFNEGVGGGHLSPLSSSLKTGRKYSTNTINWYRLDLNILSTRSHSLTH